MTKNTMMTAREISRFGGVQISAVYAAIRNGRLKSTRQNGHWYIDSKDYLDYARHRYDRKLSKVNGELVFNPEKGELSLGEVARFLRVSYGHIYNLIMTNRLPHIRKGFSYVVKKEDVDKYRENRFAFVLGKKELEG